VVLEVDKKVNRPGLEGSIPVFATTKSDHSE
jgi:hypothetical protein